MNLIIHAYISPTSHLARIFARQSAMQYLLSLPSDRSHDVRHCNTHFTDNI